jgi:hypothetical protein
MSERLETLKKARARMIEDRDAHAKVLAARFDRDKAERARSKFTEIETLIDALDRAIRGEDVFAKWLSLGKDVTRKGNWMKTLAVLVLCAFAQSAFAAGSDCSAIERTSERLTCYDAASPPKIKKPVGVESDATRAAYKDPFIAEDARTTAKLKNICRGC